MAVPPLWLSDYVAILVPIEFLPSSKGNAPIDCIAYDCYRADWDGFLDHLRDASWEDIFKLSASAAAASEFCKWLKVWTGVYIPRYK